MQVLVFLLFFYVNDMLSSILYPEVMHNRTTQTHAKKSLMLPHTMLYFHVAN